MKCFAAVTVTAAAILIKRIAIICPMAKILVFHVHVHIFIVNILIIIFFLFHADLLNRTDHQKQCNKVEVGFCPPQSILGWGFVRGGPDPKKRWAFVRHSSKSQLA